MAIKWRITINIIDLKDKYTKESLIEDINYHWLPPSFDLEIVELEVERITDVTTN